jgi:hypothetical protein
MTPESTDNKQQQTDNVIEIGNSRIPTLKIPNFPVLLLMWAVGSGRAAGHAVVKK